METGPAIIVKKGGFLATLVGGLFGFLITVVLCASGLGMYALHIADGRIDNVIQLTDTALANLREWRDVAPPFVSEAFEDQRAEEYVDNVSVDVHYNDHRARDGWGRVTFVISNDGNRDVSLLALNVVLKDRRGIPIDDFRAFAATPLPLDAREWRGPLKAGSRREFSRLVRVRDTNLTAGAEICELRVYETPGDASSAVEIASRR